MEFTPNEYAALEAIETAEERYDALQELLAEPRFDPFEDCFFGEVASDHHEEFIAMLKAASHKSVWQSREASMAAAAEWLVGKAEARRVQEAEAELNQLERDYA